MSGAGGARTAAPAVVAPSRILPPPLATLAAHAMDAAEIDADDAPAWSGPLSAAVVVHRRLLRRKPEDRAGRRGPHG